MNKKLLALAVAAALAPAAAMADSGNVVISGKIAMDVTSVNGTGLTGAADNNKAQVNNNNSVLTLAGNEDLGNGNKAFFSLTYGLNMQSAASALSGQNQIMGLEGKTWGKVFAGAFDNPLKVMGRGTDLFADQSTGDARYLTGRGAVEARANDVIAYITPSFNGFTGVLARSGNPVTTVAIDGVTDAGRSTTMNIVKLAYANGPMTAAIGHHTIDSQGTSATTNVVGGESATRLTGSYAVGALKLVGSWQKVDHAYDVAETAAGLKGANTKTWGLGAAYAMGATTVKGQYYKLTDDVVNNGAKMVAVGADYAMSKRTTLQLAYSKVSNDANAGYGGNAAVAGSDVIALSANGQDPSRLSLGMKHTF